MPSETEASVVGVRDAWDFWLSQHDVTVPHCITVAVREAVEAWLADHGEDILRSALAEAVASRRPA